MNRVIAVLTLASFVCSLPECTAVQKRPMRELSPTMGEDRRLYDHRRRVPSM